MFEEKKVIQLDKALERIFAFPISRSTFRQLQNVIFAVTEGNQETSTAILEALITGEIKQDGNKSIQVPGFKKLTEKYCVLVQVAKDVLERGEFINLVTSDVLQNPQAVVFANRIRRVDGEEMHFITDATSTMQLVHHFLNRIQEIDRAEPAKGVVEGVKKELGAIQQKLEELLTHKK